MRSNDDRDMIQVPNPFAALPSIDRMLSLPEGKALVAVYGHKQTTMALREIVDDARALLLLGDDRIFSLPGLVAQAATALEKANAPSLRPVFNLSGTVLHTNLGRAPLPTEALEAVIAVARGASNLEFDLTTGRRGDRDSHLDELLRRLTGAEAATVVNNNAAAVLLTLNTIGAGKEIIVSRGELIEIGGAFRIPDIMGRANCILCEVGTTNRTHASDYSQAVNEQTAALMKVHASNYVLKGFTAQTPETRIAAIAHDAGLPFIVDLGAGSLVDLRQYGLPHEPTVAETIASGADLVTFSGDKLLGGPQAGLIAGRRDLIEKIKRNPMKRALRVDKMTIAALEAILRLHLDPTRLAQKSATLQLLTRKQDDIRADAERILPRLSEQCAAIARVAVIECLSQIGSGSLPVESLPSAGLALSPIAGRGSGRAINAIARAFRALPIPVIGRIEDGSFILDFRCLTDSSAFAGQISALDFTSAAAP